MRLLNYHDDWLQQHARAGELGRFARFRLIEEATAPRSLLDEDDYTATTTTTIGGRGGSGVSGGRGGVSGGGGGSSVTDSLSSLTKKEEAELIARGGCDIMYVASLLYTSLYLTTPHSQPPLQLGHGDLRWL